MMPNTCDGRSLVKGKRNPVTLVRTVVARKIAVQLSSFLPPSIPSRTTSPVTIPIRLMMTCSVVNVDSDIPKIMTRVLLTLF